MSRMGCNTPRAIGFGKEGPNPTVSKVRVIVPLPAFLQIADTVLSIMLNDFLSTIFVPMPMIWEGARKNTQQADIISGLCFLVEKSLDLESAGAIAQEDIKQHYDNVDTIKVFRWLVANNCAPALAATFLRHQLLPTIHLRVGTGHAVISHRARGTLTGSRLAGQLGRIPVQDSLRKTLPTLSKLAWTFGDIVLVAATFVDNLFFTAPSLYRATKMADIVAEYLQEHWHQCMKPDSRQVLRLHASSADEAHSAGWEVLEQMTTLGIIIDSNGNISADFQQTKRKMWAAFWANAGQASVRNAPVKAKVALLNRATLPIANAHFVYWPFTQERAKTLDRAQRKMLATLQRIKPKFDDTRDSFFDRKRRQAALLQDKMGKWSKRWAKRITRWDEHLERAQTNSFPSQLRSVRPAGELQQRRWQFFDRPRCRATSGPANARFSESLCAAYEHLK